MWCESSCVRVVMLNEAGRPSPSSVVLVGVGL